MKRTRIEPTTTFLNVDLEVWSTQRLTALVEAFGEINLFEGAIGRKYMASFEAATSATSVDAIVRALVKRVRALRGPALALWNGASRRSFNIGIQAGEEPFSFELALAPATVKAIEEIRGGVVVTVYGARVTPEVKKPPARRAAR